jgi:hypothetical protein
MGFQWLSAGPGFDFADSPSQRQYQPRHAAVAPARLPDAEQHAWPTAPAPPAGHRARHESRSHPSCWCCNRPEPPRQAILARFATVVRRG